MNSRKSYIKFVPVTALVLAVGFFGISAASAANAQQQSKDAESAIGSDGPWLTSAEATKYWQLAIPEEVSKAQVPIKAPEAPPKLLQQSTDPTEGLPLEFDQGVVDSLLGRFVRCAELDFLLTNVDEISNKETEIALALSNEAFRNHEGIKGDWDLDYWDRSITIGAELAEISTDQFELDNMCDMLPGRENLG